MASSPSVSAALDQTLTEVEAALNDLRSVQNDQRHGALSEHERITLSLEWDREMHHLRTILEPAFQAGQLKPAQQVRYHELLGQLRDALPTVDELGFARPPICLEG